MTSTQHPGPSWRARRPRAGGLLAAWLTACTAVADADAAPADGSASRDRAPAATADTRIYRTREEQRDAGLKTEITPWLTAAGLLEAEMGYDAYAIRQGRDDASGRDDAATLQLGLVGDLFGLAEAEAVLEIDTDRGRFELDEGFVTLEHGSWELTLGRQYSPLGTYFSSFVSGPVIEFGETRADQMAILAYGPGDAWELSLALYRGEASRRGRNPPRWDWAVAVEALPAPGWTAQLSYQSDLADADSRLLEEQDDRYRRRVPAVAAFLSRRDERYEMSLELLGAARAFAELERDRDRPWAWNLELVRRFPGRGFELAFRIEGSGELEDEPRLQFGPAVSWRLGRQVNLTLEYLHGEFEDGLAGNDDDLAYEHRDRIGGLIAIEF